MPRFVRDLSENGKEILSMNEIVSYLLKSYTPVIDEMELLEVEMLLYTFIVSDPWKKISPVQIKYNTLIDKS